jgi:hypothetical protein
MSRSAAFAETLEHVPDVAFLESSSARSSPTATTGQRGTSPITTSVRPAYSRADSPRTIGRRQTDRTSAASLPACPAYADVSEKIVSRKPLGSLTSNARLFHSVS